jgi:ribosomal protein L11 methyltransferase
MIDYTEVEVLVGETAFIDILIAELGAMGYETFEEIEGGFRAYLPVPDFDIEALEAVLTPYSESTFVSYSHKIIPGQNWNEEWEKNFPAVIIGDDVYIRASFHEPNPVVKFDIVINPKMSFGTGHHATTSLMVAYQLELDHNDKRVLDAGTGTGVLAIMAEKLGAAYINAYDIDPWPVENTKENLAINHCTKTEVWQGVASDLVLFEPFDIVLANINRNVLLSEMTYYAGFLKQGGNLLLSGFYEEDIPILQESANNAGFTYITKRVSPLRWSMLHFVKGN